MQLAGLYSSTPSPHVVAQLLQEGARGSGLDRRRPATLLVGRRCRSARLYLLGTRQKWPLA